MNCIIAMLYDYINSRWHPIVFENRPRPSEDGTENVSRYKSRVHHTIGFPTREEALQSAYGEMTKWAEKNYSSIQYCLEKDFPWEGNHETAVMVTHFTIAETPMPVF